MSRAISLAATLVVSSVIAGCGGSSSHRSRPFAQTPTATTAASSAATPALATRRRPVRLIALLPGARRRGLFNWIPAVAVRGQIAVWIARVRASGEPGFTITLLRLHQPLVTLALHAGGSQPGGTGWRYGDEIGRDERRVVVAAFNGAFQESYGAGGFVAGGRVGWPLKRGMASVVIYRDGRADIGAWRAGVPAAGRPVAAVRQNLRLLIDQRRIASTVDGCVKVCWGDPLHEQPVVARSGLGIDARGDLVWAAGHDLSVRALAAALRDKGAVSALELDINPRWVAGYVYAHPRRAHTPVGVPLMPGQTGIPGQFLTPYFRDFFTVVIGGRSR